MKNKIFISLLFIGLNSNILANDFYGSLEITENVNNELDNSFNRSNLEFNKDNLSLVGSYYKKATKSIYSIYMYKSPNRDLKLNDKGKNLLKLYQENICKKSELKNSLGYFNGLNIEVDFVNYYNINDIYNQSFNLINTCKDEWIKSKEGDLND